MNDFDENREGLNQSAPQMQPPENDAQTEEKSSTLSGEASAPASPAPQFGPVEPAVPLVPPALQQEPTSVPAAAEEDTLPFHAPQDMGQGTSEEIHPIPDANPVVPPTQPVSSPGATYAGSAQGGYAYPVVPPAQPQNNGSAPVWYQTGNGQVPPGGYGQQPPYPPVYTMPEPGGKKPKKKNLGLRIFGVILAAVILATSVITIVFYATKEDGGQTSSRVHFNSSRYQDGGDTASTFEGGELDADIEDKPSGGQMSVAQVAEKVGAGVVSITVYSPDGSSGSNATGMILSQDGYVLTNDHIYEGISNAKFLVTLNNGKEYKARYVAGDVRADVAVLKIEDASGLTPVTFGKSSQAQVGEQVVAIGNSYGLVDTVTVGYISALNRRVSSANNTGYTAKYIQTDTAINPGNSGGPLVNLYGQVIGINSSKVAIEGYEGLCFAIPIDYALDIADQLLRNGKADDRAKLGITYTAIGTIAAEVGDLPTGLCIQSISEDSGLYNKGFVKGDVITEINGKAVNDTNEVLDIIEASKAGDNITLKIYKASAKSYETVTIRLAAYSSSSSYTTKETASAPANPFGGSGSEDDFLPPRR